ncbi:MAG: hypothetical protein IT392_11715 [Nitrospirae bacterium]|nr:hypothetical protein [Nitrospirota bacterium]
MDPLSIKKGRIIIYRLFDVASEIDLSLVESRTRGGVKRLRLSKYTSTKAIEFANPPVSVELQGFVKPLFGQDSKVNVTARAYDFGVISIAFDIQIPQQTAFAELEPVTKALDTDESIDIKAIEYIDNLIGTLGDAVIGPNINEEFTEDYMIFFIEELARPMEAAEFLKQYDPSRLLLYETQELSRHARDETMKHCFSYYPDDLLIVHLDNAFVIEPSGSPDILDILEFANAQMLELRYYSHVLDKELMRIYKELPKGKRMPLFKIRVYERFVRNIAETVTDFSQITEKVDNALKVTEDVYYARIYRTAMVLFRSREWEDSIKEKLQVVTNTYKMLYDEISTRRGHLLEIGIIVLIIIEIVLLLII